jgi:hypothetical protein
MNANIRYPVICTITILFTILGSCTPGNEDKNAGSSVQASPTNVWSDLLELTPIPYASPLPKSASSGLDGTYALFDPAPPQWWSCLRCADYRPAGGVWRVQFDKGVMRIYYEVTGWISLASYTVSGNRMYIFNDPYCKESTGEYEWKLSGGILALNEIEDPCSFGLRGENLSRQAWSACPVEDSILEQPRGCTDAVVEAIPSAPLPGSLELKVHQADVRLSPPTPEIFVFASTAETATADEVRLSYSEDSLTYGINRVLWKDTDWIEITTDHPYSSMGVQFRGDYVIGWARVLFDGLEVWRGDTSTIWSELKIHGGYIEVTGFEAGEHTLRVERLDVDSRPVVVAFFGFNR